MAEREKPYDGADDDDLATAKEEFEACYEAEADERKEMVDDLRFARLSEQWDEAIVRQREEDGRPVITISRLNAFIRQVVNQCRQNKPSMKAKPVDDEADPDTARIFDGLIRNIEAISGADVAYDTAVEFAVAAGRGFFTIDTDYATDDTFDLDILIRRVANPFSIYGDPYSTAADSSDWNLAFETELLPKEVFRRKFKGAEEVDWQDLGYDRLKGCWVEQDSILVAKRWTREQVRRTILMVAQRGEEPVVIDAEVYEANKALFDAVQSEVLGSREVLSHQTRWKLYSGAEELDSDDWAGRFIPIVPVYGDEVNVEGKRYFRSLIRDAKDANRYGNAMRALSMEIVGQQPKAPYIGPEAAFEGKYRSRWETANQVSHPFLAYSGQVAPQRSQPPSIPAGVLQEAQLATQDIKDITGIHDPSLGMRSNEISGIAIRERKGQSDTSNFHFGDNLNRAIAHGGRIILDLIPHVYSGERIIRILGETGEPENVPLGRPIVVRDPQGQPVMQPQTDEAGQPVVNGITGEPLMVEMTRVYDLTAGKYDIVIDSGPSYGTRREEAAMYMSEAMKAHPQIIPVALPILAKNLDWPGAQELADGLKAAQEAQQNNQAQQAIMQLQKQMAALQAQYQALQQDKSIDQQKVQVDAYEAETDRMEAEAKLRPPMILPIPGY